MSPCAGRGPANRPSSRADRIWSLRRLATPVGPAPSPMGWAFLPPIQRTLDTPIAPVTRPTSFPAELPAWRSPAFTSALSHAVVDTMPAGWSTVTGAVWESPRTPLGPAPSSPCSRRPGPPRSSGRPRSRSETAPPGPRLRVEHLEHEDPVGGRRARRTTRPDADPRSVGRDARRPSVGVAENPPRAPDAAWSSRKAPRPALPRPPPPDRARRAAGRTIRLDAAAAGIGATGTSPGPQPEDGPRPALGDRPRGHAAVPPPPIRESGPPSSRDIHH